jgi:uncharacterized protein YrrD
MNARELIGMTVFAIEGGRNVGTVERLLFSPEEMRVTDLVVTRASAMMADPEPQRLLPTAKLKAIGRDAITVDSEELLDVTADGELPAGTVAFDEIEKERVITESGDHIGEIASVSFRDDDFMLEYVEVGRGFLSGNALIPVGKVISVGEDVIVVKDTALDPRGEDAEQADDSLVTVVDEAETSTDPVDVAEETGVKRDTGVV